MSAGLEADARVRVGDHVWTWAAGLPRSRFSGTTVENARMSVGSQELVELVASAVAAELRLRAFHIGPQPGVVDGSDDMTRRACAAELIAAADELDGAS